MVNDIFRCSSQIQEVHRLHLTPRNSLRGKKYVKVLYPKLNFIENPKEEYWSSVTLGTVCQPQVDQTGIFGEICSALALSRGVINNYAHTNPYRVQMELLKCLSIVSGLCSSSFNLLKNLWLTLYCSSDQIY